MLFRASSRDCLDSGFVALLDTFEFLGDTGFDALVLLPTDSATGCRIVVGSCMNRYRNLEVDYFIFYACKD
jgi:hypothetical protein